MVLVGVAACSKDGSFVVGAVDNDTLELHSQTVLQGSSCSAIAINQRSGKIALARYAVLEVFEISSWPLRLSLWAVGDRDRVEEDFRNVALSADSRWVASTGWGLKATVWRCQADRLDVVAVLQGHEDWVMGLSFHPFSHHLATSSRDCTVKLWSAESWTLLRTINFGEKAYNVDWAHDGRMLVCGYGGFLCRTAPGLEILGNPEIVRYPTQQYNIWCAKFDRSGEKLISGGLGKIASIWSAHSHKNPRHFPGHTDCINSVCFGGESVFFSASDDRTVIAWSAETGSHKHLFKFSDWATAVVSFDIHTSMMPLRDLCVSRIRSSPERGVLAAHPRLPRHLSDELLHP
eukprot:TRINITY_DN8965_c0_g1_i1.p1 TRINITY_DN8965_c0_g1~~TRINITY_DN8965_c0_g1_i1.p1  ORF type:complete len:347 (-),score=70.64 TRINITY_DN8965_c0_g1_i1:38-1078(-)